MNRAFICSLKKHYSIGERRIGMGPFICLCGTGSSALSTGFVDSQPLTVPTRQESSRHRLRPRQCEVLKQSSRLGPSSSEDRLRSTVQ